MTDTVQAGPAFGNAGRPGREDAIGTPPTRPTRVPAERYYSAAFAQREVERLWPKVWQVACTVDHVAEPGEYFEYRSGPYSVLVVRDNDGQLRAFQNVCRHRGNSLCTGARSQLRELKCGYHGWTWDLAGALKRVPNRKGFGALEMSEFSLIAAKVDTWERLVFVNLDVGAIRLNDFLEAVPHDIAVLTGLQHGLHQPGLTHVTLSNEERRVISTHRNLERYLDLPESERMTGGETP